MTNHDANSYRENLLNQFARDLDHDHLENNGHPVEHGRNHHNETRHIEHTTHESHPEDHDLHQPHDHGTAH